MTKLKPAALLLSTSVAVRVVVIVPPSLPLPFIAVDTGASLIPVIAIDAVATFESEVPSLVLYVKLSLVVSLIKLMMEPLIQM